MRQPDSGSALPAVANDPRTARGNHTEPARKRGVGYESGLAQLVAKDVGGGGGLPVLEFALTELWPHQRHRQIILADHQGLGGVTGALIHRAEHTYTELAKRCAADRIKRVLLAMIRSRQGASEATRRVATREQLGPDWTVAEKLAKRRWHGSNKELRPDLPMMSGPVACPPVAI